MPTSTHDDHADSHDHDERPAEGLCFLVAEDHEFQRSMMVHMLDDLGAKAVYEALAKRLSPEVRAKVKVEASNDPTAPVGARK